MAGTDVAYSYDRETGAVVCLHCELSQVEALRSAWATAEGTA